MCSYETWKTAFAVIPRLIPGRSLYWTGCLTKDGEASVGHPDQFWRPPYWSKGEEVAIPMKVGVNILHFPKTSDKQRQQSNWRTDLTGTEILAGCQNEKCVFEDRNLVVIPSGMCMFNIHASRRWSRNSAKGQSSISQSINLSSSCACKERNHSDQRSAQQTY